jgi:hypothetical protein
VGSINKLTAIKVAKLHKRGRYGDGGGLWLQVAEGGTKSWLFRVERRRARRRANAAFCFWLARTQSMGATKR